MIVHNKKIPRRLLKQLERGLLLPLYFIRKKGIGEYFKLLIVALIFTFIAQVSIVKVLLSQFRSADIFDRTFLADMCNCEKVINYSLTWSDPSDQTKSTIFFIVLCFFIFFFFHDYTFIIFMLQGLPKSQMILLSPPWKKFKSRHWFHISEYYLAARYEVQPRISSDTVYIAAPNQVKIEFCLISLRKGRREKLT